MRIILSIAVSVFLPFGEVLAAEEQEEKQDTKSQKEKLSYSLGYDIGRRMKMSTGDIDPETFINAFREGFAGNKAAMTEEEMRNALLALQKQTTAMQAERKKESAKRQNELGEKNKKEGEAFLAENAKKEGGLPLPGGLQY